MMLIWCSDKRRPQRRRRPLLKVGRSGVDPAHTVVHTADSINFNSNCTVRTSNMCVFMATHVVPSQACVLQLLTAF